MNALRRKPIRQYSFSIGKIHPVKTSLTQIISRAKAKEFHVHSDKK